MTTKTLDQQTARFIASMATCLPSLSSEIMQGWIDNPQGLKKYLSGLNPSADETPLADNSAFRLIVNYSRTLEQMIAAGLYDWTNSDITAKSFPVTGEGTVEFEAKLFHLARDISSENAIEAMKNAGYEPAAIEHLLAFGEKYPEEQRKYPVVALGSLAAVNDFRDVPYLYRHVSGRNLDLAWFDDDWRGYCRFLAVRKVSVS
jgi:hypothetical protein